MKSAVDKYIEFHALEPREVGQFPASFKIPAEVQLAGDAVHVLYRSGKVDPATDRKPKRPLDYIHDHKKGVKVYRADAHYSQRQKRTPKWIRETKALVLLGQCLGFAYRDGDGYEVDGKASSPYPELYTTPNGRCLVVVQDKRRVVALIWGGTLGVERRGIVG